jgi:hypothetical protein
VVKRSLATFAVALAISGVSCAQVLGLNDPKNDGGGASGSDAGDGLKVPSVDALATLGVARDGSNIVDVFLASVSGICALAQQDQVPSNAKGILIETLAAPGSYSIAEATVSASYLTSNSTCVITPTQATSGTVTIMTIDASSVALSFDLVFPSAELTGTFGVPMCGGVTPATLFAPPYTCM